MAKKPSGTVKPKTGGSAKKSSAVKTAKKPVDPVREPLFEELRTLLPKLDNEGLAFLVKQAKIHLYNMQVDKLNEEARELNAQTAGTEAVVSSVEKPQAKEMKIIGTESGSSYYLHYRNNAVMFSRNEMIHLVKIVNAPGTDLEIRERLYNWFDRERKDVFATIPMKDKFDNRLSTLAALVKKSFKLQIENKKR